MKKFIVLIVVVSVLVITFRTINAPLKIEQPIKYNHKKHVKDLGLECNTCHTKYENHTMAGKPTAEICGQCHAVQLTEKPEEKKLVEYIEKGREIKWRRIYKLQENVYFSHRMHAVIGKIECSECHGNISELESPPSGPLVKQTMKWCTACHDKNNVRNDCFTCHR
ncbi:MAG: cytochrome c3 family protein [bacterium]